MTAADLIKQLVDRFDQQYDTYRSSKYNETQLRHYAWRARSNPPTGRSMRWCMSYMA